MGAELTRLRRTERWIAWVRVGAVGFAVLQVALSSGFPPGYEPAAWGATAALAVGAVVVFAIARRDLAPASQRRLGLLALGFDVSIVFTFVLIFSFERGTPVRQLVFVPLIEAALRYGTIGALGFALASVPVLAVFEHLRSSRLPPHQYAVDYVTFQIGIEVIAGLIVGWLVKTLRSETARAEARAAEAEALRDGLGRRVDLLDAANRCARALGSSLELEQAFNAFIRELRGLIHFDRAAIILSEKGLVQVMATAGLGADEILPPGTTFPQKEALLGEILQSGKTVYRDDISELRHPEEEELLRLGLRSRLMAPLLVGARPIGALVLLRVEPRSFTPDEIELATLLGRLVATAVQNIRAYEAERATVDELRQLSALRADFVSLVSHELRSPMAAVIGSARTLQDRWRELAPEQRNSFLALIADETNRLAAMIGDVLDTSRIEAGTFSYTFSNVDIGELVRESVATAALGQDEVGVDAETSDPLPFIRGDRERLKQVLMNLIENAVKYSPAGARVAVRAYAQDGAVWVEVADAGPGIAREHQKLIFEKFGRVSTGVGAKPGSGLGLFIARSIAESHGGSLEVRSAPQRGSTFTLELPF